MERKPALRCRLNCDSFVRIVVCFTSARPAVRAGKKELLMQYEGSAAVIPISGPTIDASPIIVRSSMLVARRPAAPAAPPSCAAAMVWAVSPPCAAIVLNPGVPKLNVPISAKGVPVGGKDWPVCLENATCALSAAVVSAVVFTGVTSVSGAPVAAEPQAPGTTTAASPAFTRSINASIVYVASGLPLSFLGAGAALSSAILHVNVANAVAIEDAIAAIAVIVSLCAPCKSWEAVGVEGG